MNDLGRDISFANDIARYALRMRQARKARLLRRQEDRLRQSLPITTSRGCTEDAVDDDSTAGESSSSSSSSSSGNEAGSLSLPYHSGNSSALECTLCLEPYSTGEQLRTLPCQHVFHASCIDCWLFDKCDSAKRACPLCRRDPLKLMKSPKSPARVWRQCLSLRGPAAISPQVV